MYDFEHLVFNAFIVFIIFGVLPLVASSLASLVFAFFQAVTSVQEQSILHLIKVSVLIILIYFFHTDFMEMFKQLIQDWYLELGEIK